MPRDELVVEPERSAGVWGPAQGVRNSLSSSASRLAESEPAQPNRPTGSLPGRPAPGQNLQSLLRRLDQNLGSVGNGRGEMGADVRRCGGLPRGCVGHSMETLSLR